MVTTDHYFPPPHRAGPVADIGGSRERDKHTSCDARNRRKVTHIPMWTENNKYFRRKMCSNRSSIQREAKIDDILELKGNLGKHAPSHLLRPPHTCPGPPPTNTHRRLGPMCDFCPQGPTKLVGSTAAPRRTFPTSP